MNIFGKWCVQLAKPNRVKTHETEHFLVALWTYQRKCKCISLVSFTKMCWGSYDQPDESFSWRFAVTTSHTCEAMSTSNIAVKRTPFERLWSCRVDGMTGGSCPVVSFTSHLGRQPSVVRGPFNLLLALMEWFSLFFLLSIFLSLRTLLGLFLKGKCSKGRLCNFLHVFRNPDGMFREADRDFEIRRHPTATGAAQVTPRDRPSAQSPTESSVRTKRQWRWSESPPSKSMKLQESTDGKEKSKR